MHGTRLRQNNRNDRGGGGGGGRGTKQQQNRLMGRAETSFAARFVTPARAVTKVSNLMHSQTLNNRLLNW